MFRSDMFRSDMSGNGLAIAAMLLISAGLCLAQTSRADAPTRTMGAGATGVQAVSGGGSQAGFNTTAAMERYRQMWQRMTPAQQTVFVHNGGRTPEDYERMLKGSVSPFSPPQFPASQSASGAQFTPGTTLGRTDGPRGADSGALDSLSKSLQDLNAIRDGNLGRVQKDGCPPGIAARIAALTGELRSDEFELNGGRPPSSRPGAMAPAASIEKSSQADPLAVAGDWFKSSPGQKSPGSESGNGNSPAGKLLDAVLTGSEPAAANSPETAQKRAQRKLVLEEDIARIKTELGQLSGACATSKP